MINIFKKLNNDEDSVDIDIDMLHSELESYLNNVKDVNQNYSLDYDIGELKYLNREKEIIINFGFILMALLGIFLASITLSILTLSMIGIFQYIKFAFISRQGLNKRKYDEIESNTDKIKKLINNDKFKYLLIKNLEKEYTEKVKDIKDESFKKEEDSKIKKLINELKLSLIENDFNTVYKIVDVIYFIKNNQRLNDWLSINNLDKKLEKVQKSNFLNELFDKDEGKEKISLTKKEDIKKLL